VRPSGRSFGGHVGSVWHRHFRAIQKASRRVAGSPHALLAAALQGIAAALLHPLIIVAFLVSELSSAPRDVALVAVIAGATWYVPSLLNTWLAAYYHRVFPVALAASFVRVIAASSMAAVMLGSAASDATLARLVLLALVAYQLASAAFVPAGNDLIARATPAEHRARLYRARWLVGGVSALLAGAVIAAALGSDTPPLREAFGALFLTAAFAIAGESWFILRLREPGPARLSEERAGAIAGSRIREALAVRGFRRLLVFRVALALAASGDPFLIVYGMSEIAPGRAALGVYVALFAFGALVGGAMGLDLSNLGAVRPIFQFAALLRFATPLLALLFSFLATGGVVATSVAAWLFGSVFLLLGLEIAITTAATQPAVFAVAPAGTRGAAITLLNVALGVCALGPLLGSRLVERQGIAALLVVAAGLSFVTIMLSGILAPSTRRPAPRRQRRPAPRRARPAQPRRAVPRR
ncbi:MAG: hypothetical protein M3N45_05450, partial [Actinomycetota bacterium]|nr:hypothetical protein [Actinomycetota bacterium]